MHMMDKEMRDLELVTEEADPQKVAEDMAVKIRKMYEDRDKKVKNAKESLISQLEVTASKYLTANGVMSALEIVRTVYDKATSIGLESEIDMAKTMATAMSVIALKLKEKAEGLEPENFDKLCDGFYDAHYAEDDDASAIQLVQQLMMLQLCQNVGPNADDIAAFIKHSNYEIDKAKADLISYCEENGIDFLKLCGEDD